AIQLDVAQCLEKGRRTSLARFLGLTAPVREDVPQTRTHISDDVVQIAAIRPRDSFVNHRDLADLAIAADRYGRRYRTSHAELELVRLLVLVEMRGPVEELVVIFEVALKEPIECLCEALTRLHEQSALLVDKLLRADG